MRRLTLVRIAENNDGTFGVLIDNLSSFTNVPFCLTLERRWQNNERGKSCIPAGKYVCMQVDSPKFGITFKVISVPGRSDILFHKGNIMDDTHGCIILGEQFEPLNGKNAVLSSGQAFTEFMYRTSGSNIFELLIREATA